MQEKQLALQLLHRWKTNDPFELCQMLDILVLRVALDESVRGFYQHVLNTDIIYIRQDLPPCQQRFVCAHELGHALLHQRENRIFLDTATYQITARMERSANLFASYVTYPEDSIFLEYPDYTVEQLAGCLGLPAPLVELRLSLARQASQSKQSASDILLAQP